MSVLVAALARTKNNFTGSIHTPEKGSSGEKPQEISPRVAAALTEMSPSTAHPAGPSEGEDTFPKGFERQFSTVSCRESEEDEGESAPIANESVLGGLGPLVTLKEQLERDKVGLPPPPRPRSPLCVFSMVWSNKDLKCESMRWSDFQEYQRINFGITIFPDMKERRCGSFHSEICFQALFCSGDHLLPHTILAKNN